MNYLFTINHMKVKLRAITLFMILLISIVSLIYNSFITYSNGYIFFTFIIKFVTCILAIMLIDLIKEIKC